MGALIRILVRPILAILFLIAFVPTNLVLRALGKNPMGLRYDTKLKSYRRLSTNGERS